MDVGDDGLVAGMGTHGVDQGGLGWRHGSIG